MKRIRKKFTKLQKDEKGITLVALVITIVILIILATIAINFIFGNNGLINRAEEAKKEVIVADEKEKIEMAYAAKKIDKITENSDNKAITDTELQEELDKQIPGKTKVTLNSDGTLNVYFEETKNNYTVSNGQANQIEKIEVNIMIPSYSDEYGYTIETLSLEKNTTWKDLFLGIKNNMEKYNITFNSSDLQEMRNNRDNLVKWYKDYFGKEPKSSDEYNVWYRVTQYIIFGSDRFGVIGYEDYELYMQLMEKEENNEEITEEEMNKLYETMHIIKNPDEIINPNNYIYQFSWDS